MDKRYLTVSALNKYIKAKIDHDIQLQSLLIKGEISNLKKHSSGHIYFTLKDDQSRISAVMFSSKARKLNFDLKNGDKVLIEASVSVYYVTGSYQLYVNNIELDGIGNLFLKFEKLKKDLSRDGLFDEQHKKRIPQYPSKIAVLSAYPSAALMDIVRTIKLRFPIVRIVIFPVPVQGKDAYKMIIRTLKYVDTLKFNTIIIARGGGTLEDLWNFNEEELARTIYECQTPIISGVGHEIDFTICDFVSDYRAATPTAAAIKATPDIQKMKNELHNFEYHLVKSMNYKVASKKSVIDNLVSYYLFKNPEKLYINQMNTLSYFDEQLIKNFKLQLENKKRDYLFNQKTLNHQITLFSNNLHNKLDNINHSLVINIQNKTHDSQQKLGYILSQLNALSPLKTLERGYAIVLKDSQTMTSQKNLKTNDLIEIKFKDGTVKAIIK